MCTTHARQSRDGGEGWGGFFQIKIFSQVRDMGRHEWVFVRAINLVQSRLG